MKINSARLAFSTSLFALAVLVFSAQAYAQMNNRVTAGAAGPIKIGMSLFEARSALPNMKFEETADGDGLPLIAVGKGKKVHFTLYAGQEDPDMPISFNRIIEQIEVWSSSYKTQGGIGPGTLISDAEKKYGPVKEIMLSEIESREYVEFSNGPEGIGFRIDYSGVFEGNERTTRRYKKAGKIFSLIIQGDGSESNIGFYSDYTDLEKQCKTPAGQGEEGGHVSTYCDGPEKFRVHMFDTALSLEINIESSESGESVSIISESLEFMTKRKKLEWRFKHGVPFAVILRGNRYETDEGGLIKYPSVKTGEFLFVRGLPGFESIKADVNVRTTKFANDEARQIADEGYATQKFPVSKDFEIVDTKGLNFMIVAAADKGESWVKSAVHVAARITSEFAEMRSRQMYFETPSGESSDSFTLTVVNEGLLDDSIKSEKLVFELIKEDNGIWKVSSAKKAWACWPGRGHQDFSALPCI